MSIETSELASLHRAGFWVYTQLDTLVYCSMENVHISLIKVGDAILHDGKVRTVCKDNIQEGGFMGRSIFGDSYSIGYRLVQRVVFK